MTAAKQPPHTPEMPPSSGLVPTSGRATRTRSRHEHAAPDLGVVVCQGEVHARRVQPQQVLLEPPPPSPGTACFAAGADEEGRSTDELCAEVAAALRARDASWAERHLAVVAAAMRGRYKSMVRAMEQANLDLTTLRRWHDQAIFAQSAAEALE